MTHIPEAAQKGGLPLHLKVLLGFALGAIIGLLVHAQGLQHSAVVEHLIAWLTSARRPGMSRSTEGASTGVDCIASCMAWATALVNISERRAGLSGGSSFVVRERRSSARTDILPGGSPAPRSPGSRESL